MLRKRNTAIVTSGVLSALSLVIMMLTAVLPVASLTLCAMAGMFLAVVIIEFGYRYALASCFVTAALSVLLVADKESVVLYTLFFGLYPIVKGCFERLRHKPLVWVVKIAFFNAAMVVYYYLAVWIIGVPADSFSFVGDMAPTVLLLIANVVFVFYDIAFSRLIALYIFRLQGNLRRRLGL